jgi:hypothetical protein
LNQQDVRRRRRRFLVVLFALVALAWFAVSPTAHTQQDL